MHDHLDVTAERVCVALAKTTLPLCCSMALSWRRILTSQLALGQAKRNCSQDSKLVFFFARKQRLDDAKFAEACHSRDPLSSTSFTGRLRDKADAALEHTLTTFLRKFTNEALSIGPIFYEDKAGVYRDPLVHVQRGAIDPVWWSPIALPHLSPQHILNPTTQEKTLVVTGSMPLHWYGRVYLKKRTMLQDNKFVLAIDKAEKTYTYIEVPDGDINLLRIKSELL